MYTVINQTNLRISQERENCDFLPHSQSQPTRVATRVAKEEQNLATFIAEAAAARADQPLQRTAQKIKVHGINFYDKLIKHKLRTLRARLAVFHAKI